MNLASAITSIRIVLAPFFFIICTILNKSETYNKNLVIVLWALFLIMELSDAFDGMAARKQHIVTDFGKLFDPFADSFARLTYFFSFLIMGIMPAWAFLFVFYRDLGVSFVRILAMKKGTAMAAQISGKIKAWIYAFGAVIGLIIITVKAFGIGTADTIVVIEKIAFGIYALCALTAVWTMIDYTRAYKNIKQA